MSDANSTVYSDAELTLLRDLWAGGYVGPLVYGVHITLYALWLYLMFNGKQLRSVSWLMVGYMTLVAAIATIYIGANTKWTQLILVDEGQNYPGGPFAYFNNFPSLPVYNLGNAAYIITGFLTDAIMIWRCWMVWDRSYLAVVFPALLFLGSTACSVTAVIQFGLPAYSTPLTDATNFMVPYFALSVAMNLLITLMIGGKLLYARAQLRRLLGSKAAQVYTSVAAMLTESAALYSVCNVGLIIVFCLGDPSLNTLFALQSQIMCIAPLLILIRVARGRAYSTEIATTLRTSEAGRSNPSRPRAVTVTTDETFVHSSWKDDSVNELKQFNRQDV